MFWGEGMKYRGFGELLNKAGFVTLSVTPLDGDALVAIEATKEDK